MHRRLIYNSHFRGNKFFTPQIRRAKRLYELGEEENRPRAPVQRSRNSNFPVDVAADWRDKGRMKYFHIQQMKVSRYLWILNSSLALPTDKSIPPYRRSTYRVLNQARFLQTLQTSRELARALKKWERIPYLLCRRAVAEDLSSFFDVYSLVASLWSFDCLYIHVGGEVRKRELH